MAATRKSTTTKKATSQTRKPAKPRARKAPAKTGTKAPAGAVRPEERHRRIAEAAYYIALQRGAESDPQANWLEAERQIDAALSGKAKA